MIAQESYHFMTSFFSILLYLVINNFEIIGKRDKKYKFKEKIKDLLIIFVIISFICIYIVRIYMFVFVFKGLI